MLRLILHRDTPLLLNNTYNFSIFAIAKKFLDKESSNPYINIVRALSALISVTIIKYI